MLTRTLIPHLQCTSCRSGHLDFRLSDPAATDLENGLLICNQCQTEFAVQQNIPDLIPASRLDSNDWKIWQSHLDGFYERRRSEQEKMPSTSEARRWHKKRLAFEAFLDVPPGLVLDIGCGPGSIRQALDVSQTTYVGIDPIPADGVEDFLFARALAEYLPFQDETFDCLIARSALDHFCDLSGFFTESARVLKPGGVMFIEQAIHGEGGLGGFTRTLVHEAKDFLDNRKNANANRDAPKHMTDFTEEMLLAAPGELFEVTATRQYAPNLLAAAQQFIALKKN